MTKVYDEAMLTTMEMADLVYDYEVIETNSSSGSEDDEEHLVAFMAEIEEIIDTTLTSTEDE